MEALSKNLLKLKSIWGSMMQRCYNPKNKNYHQYGQRGVKVVQRWHKFNNFASDMGCRPNGLTLDRIDNNGNYSKKNCRWATYKQQQRNRRSNLKITLNGETKCLTEWSDINNLSRRVVNARLRKYGWSVEEALGIKLRSYKINKWYQITFEEETLCLLEWCKKLGLKYNTVHGRIYKCGWTPLQALKLIPRTPVKQTTKTRERNANVCSMLNAGATIKQVVAETGMSMGNVYAIRNKIKAAETKTINKGRL